MNKNIKRYAALSIIWAQVAFAGAIAADEANDNESKQDNNVSSMTVAAAQGNRPHNNSFYIPEKPSETPYINAQTKNTAEPDSWVTVSTKSGKKISRLINEFNTSANVEGLCIAGGMNELLDEIQKSENISRSEAVIIIVNALSPQQIRALPTQTKADLIASVDVSKMDYTEFYTLKKLYMNAIEDPAYHLWDAEKQLELARAVRDNPVLQKARQNWPNMTDQEKLDAMQVAVDLTINTYGKEIGAKSVELDYMQHSNKNIHGMYSLSARKMFLNLNSDAIPENFEQTVSVTIHEALHAYHHQLIDNVTAGTLDKNHPAYKHANLMKESFPRYLWDGMDYAAYLSNPTERHAWEITYIGKYAGAGPGVSLQRPENSVTIARSIHEQFKEHRKRLNDAVSNDNSMSCQPLSIKLPRWNP